MKKIALYVMAICVSLMMWNCKGGTNGESNQDGGDSTAVSNPLNVAKPTMVKFVRVVAEDGTNVYRDVDVESSYISSPWRVTWVEDIESDMADIVDKWSDEKVPDGYLCSNTPAYPGEVLAVLGEESGEEGSFYKVSIHNERSDMEFGYIRKGDAADVEPETLTEDMLKELADEYDWVHTRVVKDGKYKGIVICSIMDELQGERFEVGVMMDGYMAFPEKNSVFIEYDPNIDRLTFIENKPNEFPIYFKYPKSMAHLSEYDYSNGFDPDKLTDEQIETIVQDMQKRTSEYVKYEFVIPMTEGGLQSFWLRNNNTKQ